MQSRSLSGWHILAVDSRMEGELPPLLFCVVIDIDFDMYIDVGGVSAVSDERLCV